MAIGQLSRFPAAAIKRRKSWVVMMIVAAKYRVQFREEASRENFLGKAKEHFFIHKKYLSSFQYNYET